MKTIAPLTDEQQKLVEENLGLVHAEVKHYWTHEAYEDFRTAGYVGLMRAAAKFDPSKGKFSSYAWRWIDGAIKAAVRDEYSVEEQHDDTARGVEDQLRNTPWRWAAGRGALHPVDAIPFPGLEHTEQVVAVYEHDPPARRVVRHVVIHPSRRAVRRSPSPPTDAVPLPGIRV